MVILVMNVYRDLSLTPDQRAEIWMISSVGMPLRQALVPLERITIPNHCEDMMLIVYSDAENLMALSTIVSTTTTRTTI